MRRQSAVTLPAFDPTWRERVRAFCEARAISFQEPDWHLVIYS